MLTIIMLKRENKHLRKRHSGNEHLSSAIEQQQQQVQWRILLNYY
jgi:hypothetical protein